MLQTYLSKKNMVTPFLNGRERSQRPIFFNRLEQYLLLTNAVQTIQGSGGESDICTILMNDVDHF